MTDDVGNQPPTPVCLVHVSCSTPSRCTALAALAVLRAKAAHYDDHEFSARLDNLASALGLCPGLTEAQVDQFVIAHCGRRDVHGEHDNDCVCGCGDDFEPAGSPSIAALHRQWLDQGLPAHTWVTWMRQNAPVADDAMTPEPRSVAHNANARTGVYLGELRDV